mmetsp:Transcript_11128/g.35304  ORF Transcript_11128/g.35304 Transcript_11128/m.35304 type:complete len:216 (+) Transcript_11128:3703-4350(+)
MMPPPLRSPASFATNSVLEIECSDPSRNIAPPPLERPFVALDATEFPSKRLPRTTRGRVQDDATPPPYTALLLVKVLSLTVKAARLPPSRPSRKMPPPGPAAVLEVKVEEDTPRDTSSTLYLKPMPPPSAALFDVNSDRATEMPTTHVLPMPMPPPLEPALLSEKVQPAMDTAAGMRPKLQATRPPPTWLAVLPWNVHPLSSARPPIIAPPPAIS